MRLMTIDLGKFKSVACLYGGEDDVTFRTIETRPQAVHDLVVAWAPERLVIEVGTVSGWVYDVATALGVEVQVANPNTEGWRWRRVKRKTDRDDALKLARLSAAGQLPMVWMPKRQVRQWRSLIHYRHALVSRRTAIRCSIRSVLDMHGLRMPMGPKAWTEVGVEHPSAGQAGDRVWARGVVAGSTGVGTDAARSASSADPTHRSEARFTGRDRCADDAAANDSGSGPSAERSGCGLAR